jgi:hypothetical protein
MIANGLFWLPYLLGNYAACVNAKEPDLRWGLTYGRSPGVTFAVLLCCVVLCCVVLFCVVLCCIVLFCVVLCCVVLCFYLQFYISNKTII